MEQPLVASGHKIKVIPFNPATFDPQNPVAGIYSDMPIRYYHSPAMSHILSKSGLVTLRSCPAAAKLPDKNSAALSLGRATDPYILENEAAFNREFIVMPDYPCPAGQSEKGWHNTKAYKEKVKEFESANASSGKEVVDPADFEKIRCMDFSVKLNPWAQLILSQSHTQLTYIWQDTDIVFPDGTCMVGTGKWCKSRPDMTCLHSLDCSDLKTAKSVTHHGFQSAMLIYGYDVQAGMAFEAFWRLTGLVLKNFTMITVQSNPPFQCEVWPLIDEQGIPDSAPVEVRMMSPWILGGILEFHRLVKLYATCEAENFWPAYKPVYEKGKWMIRKANYIPLLTPGYYKPGEGLWEEVPE
jgi:hypothetical protein